MASEPKTLQAAIVYFADPVNCREYMVARRWVDGVTCPRCGTKNVLFLEKYNRWHCREKHKAPQFTLKTGTIFEDSPIGLDKWLTAMWMTVNCKNGVSSWELHRTLGVTQKSAWFMLGRIRLALQSKPSTKVGGEGGEAEVDETYIGGSTKNMHKGRIARIERERAMSTRPQHTSKGRYSNKVGVFGIFDREQRKVRASVIPQMKRKVLQEKILKEVDQATKIYSDESTVYCRLSQDYVHETVNQLHQYVDGRIHTNGIENFWSLLKRTLNGTYVAVEPFHLDRYVDEQAFRFNNRATKDNPLNDSDRFDLAIRQVVGKRLTYADLTGREVTEPF
jgi:transposase-like protein